MCGFDYNSSTATAVLNFFYYFLGKLVGYSISISFHTVSFEYYFRLGKQHFARSYRGRLVCSTC
ncbi:hypothetical protein VCR4J2_340011 [Vibrio coralliirubri]|nr:hypothetical protein VCR4J2_340011 [Vibrio coralliirubri]